MVLNPSSFDELPIFDNFSSYVVSEDENKEDQRELYQEIIIRLNNNNIINLIIPPDEVDLKKINKRLEVAIERNYKNRVLENDLVNFTDDIMEISQEPKITTGFNGLDDVFNGGLRNELIILGAISSLGKTTFVLQVMNYIAQQKKDVLFFSLEMSKKELISKSVSRESARISMIDSLSNTDVMYKYNDLLPNQQERVHKSIINYNEKAGKHLVIYEGQGDIGVIEIRKAIELHIRVTKKIPVIAIDYLQVMKPIEKGLQTKDNIDQILSALKVISRDYGTSIVLVSSFNRSNYNQPVNMGSFKESGGIEYSSDVLIGLEFGNIRNDDFDIDKERQRTPREIEAVILKNRNGISGQKLKFNYYPRVNVFEERS